MTTVLVVDDDAAIREMIRMALESKGYDVLEATDAIDARHQMEACPADIMLLDWMMPGQSGYDFTRSLRRNSAATDISIIMLTARDREDERIAALEAGADDYISKPFSVRELLARIKAVLRRSATVANDAILDVDGLVLDQPSHRVTAGEAQLRLSPQEYQLLRFLMLHPERVFSRSQLIARVWSEDHDVEERTVDVQIRRLRNILQPSGHDRLIQTVRGTGYLFSARS